MSENTRIEWCDHTFNPWIGCTKVSPGCAHCYAETLAYKRHLWARWGKGQPRKRTSEANWKQPIKWNRGYLFCGSCGEQFQQLTGRQKLCEPIPGDNCHRCNFGKYRRTRVFCASLSDWLDDEVPIEWLADLLGLIYSTPNLDWLLLTKRPENFAQRMRAVYDCDAVSTNTQEDAREWANGKRIPPHIWIGVSIEDQQRANERIPHLLKIPARVRFLSVEPMLGPIDLCSIPPLNRNAPCTTDSLTGRTQWPDGDSDEGSKIHWAIFGGESGGKARPCHLEWISDGVRQCRAAGVAPFVKQLGSDSRTNNLNLYDLPDSTDFEPSDCMEGPAPVRLILKHKKGSDPAEWPQDLRVREFYSL